MSTAELTCQELVEIVTDYVEGEMALDERLRFEDHLRSCPGCTAYVDQMRETIRLTGELHEDDVVPEARDRLLALFQNWSRGESRR